MHFRQPPPDDHHFLREDRTTRWRAIAAHLEAHPEDFRIAPENIARWLALGRVHPGPHLEWRERIHAAREPREQFRELIAFLAAPNHDEERLKSCSPFAGLPISTPGG